MADIFVQGLTVGWIFGRLGCTVVHDHPGKLSDFFLAVNYPEGARHNLGLYEFLYTLLVLLPAILFVHRRVPYRPGIYVAIVSLLYGAVRFPLEFLRLPETDPRYGGLTFAQYSSLFLVGLGLWLLARPTKRSAANSRPDGI
jgi:phosphatidylglycerol:prolipoprotein diacylglycerol transferase